MARNDHDGRSLEERLASLDAMSSEATGPTAVPPAPKPAADPEKPVDTGDSGDPGEGDQADEESTLVEPGEQTPSSEAPSPPPAEPENPWLAPPPFQDGPPAEGSGVPGQPPTPPPGFPPAYNDFNAPPPYAAPPPPYEGSPMPQPFDGGMLPPPYAGNFQQPGQPPQPPQPPSEGGDIAPPPPSNGQGSPPLEQLPPYPPGQQPPAPQFPYAPAEGDQRFLNAPPAEGAQYPYTPNQPPPVPYDPNQPPPPGAPHDANRPPLPGAPLDPNQPPPPGAPYDPNQPPPPGAPFDANQPPPGAPYDANQPPPPGAPYDPNQPSPPGAPYDPNQAMPPGGGPYPTQGYGPPMQPLGEQQHLIPGMPPPGAYPQEQQEPPEPQTAESLSSENLLGERRIAPSGGWRRAVYKATAGSVHPGESQAEMRRKDLVARARQPVGGGHHRVAVMSLKGGVGKTTTTTGLGSMLASLRGDRVIAVDANPDRGTLSDKVKLETAATVRDLLNNRDKIHRYADVRGFTSQNGARLEVLASDRDPAVSEAFSAEDYSAVAVVLEQYYSICITDCGTGLLHSAMAGVLSLADQLVLVSSPSVDGARSASATLDWLEAHDHGHLVRNGVVVLSMVRNRTRSQVDLDKLQAHFESRCRAVVRIPYDDHLEEGAEVELEALAPHTREAYLNLAAVVGDGLGHQRRPHE
ncbi:MinD/ParA family protein [Spirillospora sp. NPDC029432]|uniref:MinD/ParA family ATP-binding protein n=1 Tax=Spirillospora sp. NPDC029432 TaxID=3154599 RepID=UPI0034549BA1